MLRAVKREGKHSRWQPFDLPDGFLDCGCSAPKYGLNFYQLVLWNSACSLTSYKTLHLARAHLVFVLARINPVFAPTLPVRLVDRRSLVWRMSAIAQEQTDIVD